MAKLNQIIALEKGVKSKGQQALTGAHNTMKRVSGFSGLSRVYTPKDDDGDRYPAESTRVQNTVGDVIGNILGDLTRMYDVVLTKDAANQIAKADIVVDGAVIASKVPVTYLLWLEKQLVDLHTFFVKLPVLDADELWNLDPSTNWFRTDPVSTGRTKKVYKNHVLAEATKDHPAQVQVYTEDITVGSWSTTKFSGAIPAPDRQVLVERVEKLAEAVKVAREEANSLTVTDHKVGESVFAFLLGTGD